MLNNYEFVFKSVYSVFYGHVFQNDTFFSVFFWSWTSSRFSIFYFTRWFTDELNSVREMKSTDQPKVAIRTAQTDIRVTFVRCKKDFTLHTKITIKVYCNIIPFILFQLFSNL